MTVGLGIVVLFIDAPLSPQSAAMFVLMSGSATFVALALSLRIAMWPSMSKRMIVLWLAWLLLILPIVGLWYARDDVGNAPFLLVTGIILVIAAWLLYDGRRAWLNLELG
jgi:glucose dehydrogenase